MTSPVGRHVTRHFRGHPVFAVDVPAHVLDRVPGLQILEVGGGPRTGLTTYVTLGCWEAVQAGGEGVEFVLSAREPDIAHAATLASVAARHCSTPQQRLDRGSVVPLGKPWTPGSTCDRLLVTLPYPYGPDFEWCRWRRNSARLLWLMPITPEEAAYVAEYGVDALERRFEESQVHFADPERPSVV
jgi:Suppressor of fused protein (SUFU)